MSTDGETLFCAEGPKDAFVCVLADSAVEARDATGLGDLSFHEATEADTRRWDALSEKPLNERDVEVLIQLARRGQSELARRFRVARGKGQKPHRNMVWRAIKLAELRGKLEMLEVEGADPPQAETLLDEGSQR